MGKLVKGIRLGISHSVGRRIRNRIDLTDIESPTTMDMGISEEIEIKKSALRN